MTDHVLSTMYIPAHVPYETCVPLASRCIPTRKGVPLYDHGVVPSACQYHDVTTLAYSVDMYTMVPGVASVVGSSTNTQDISSCCWLH